MDTLRAEFPGTHVLDLYSGKGRFGFGALEEGAKRVSFVEKSPNEAETLKKEGKKWAEGCRVFSNDVFAYLHRAKEENSVFDIVFADPPFRLWEGKYSEELVNAVLPVLKKPAIFLVRHPKKVVVSFAIPALEEWKTSIFGDSKLIYFSHVGG